jgi:hypothetical protein
VIAADPSAVLHPACSCRLVDPCRLAWLSRPAGSTGELAGGVVGSASYRIGCEVGWRDEKVVNGKYRTVTAPPPRRTSQTHVAAPRTRPRPLLILLSGRLLPVTETSSRRVDSPALHRSHVVMSPVTRKFEIMHCSHVPPFH